MRNSVLALFLVGLACTNASAEGRSTAAVPPALQVRAELPLMAGVTDLKFRDFFTLPIGPRGLAPSARLLGLVGQRVRVVGYMARQSEASPGIVIVAALPVVLGDEDESYADDLPASTLYVHLAAADRHLGVRWMSGLLGFTGVLQLGALSETDGRTSFVRLQLDPELSHDLVAER